MPLQNEGTGSDIPKVSPPRCSARILTLGIQLPRCLTHTHNYVCLFHELKLVRLRTCPFHQILHFVRAGTRAYSSLHLRAWQQLKNKTKQKTVHLLKDSVCSFLRVEEDAKTSLCPRAGIILVNHPGPAGEARLPESRRKAESRGNVCTCLSVPEEPKVWRMPLCRMFEMPSMLKRWGEEGGGGLTNNHFLPHSHRSPGTWGSFPSYPDPPATTLSQITPGLKNRPKFKPELCKDQE